MMSVSTVVVFSSVAMTYHDDNISHGRDCQESIEDPRPNVAVWVQLAESKPEELLCNIGLILLNIGRHNDHLIFCKSLLEAALFGGPYIADVDSQV